MCEEKLTRFLNNLRLYKIAKVNRFFCLLIILAGYISVACGGLSYFKVPTVRPITEGESVDLDLFSDDICQVPCWYGLELGKSTKTDALAILPTIPFLNTDTIEEDETYYQILPGGETVTATGVHADCNTPDRHCVALIYVEDRLVAMLFFLDNSLTIRTLVDHFGPPDFITGHPQVDGNNCDLSYFWEAKQMYAGSRLEGGKQTCMNIFMEGELINGGFPIAGIQIELPGYIESGKEDSMPWPGFIEP